MGSDPRRARHPVGSGYGTPPTGAMTIPACTQRQRDLVRFYFKNRGLPTVYLTDEHQGLFNQAGIVWRYGALLDKTLRAVSQAAAQRLINVVKESV
ncbi:hypothetical protein [Xanthomonas nasturtii]|uniref:Uncharacterized protein n=1 Tax=Xanthomonas nasturtii TaxID=1843581 RepID=A0ABT0LMB3_9XANT|nr:hypothetical protein [Xanthomonas nasturtii]MCL1550492.1 hypothetical protein [Xanthomonas nasturtii]MCL1554718.1 hypothetical protein [Xanthomonas nasturtii]MCL1561284.1 hypothetical protein [Xanthomonas nasturtii]